MRKLQRLSTAPVLLLAGGLMLATGCGPQDPTITVGLQEPTALSGGEEVRLAVSYDAEGPITIQWTATAGTLRENSFEDSVTNTWQAPYCIPEGAPLPVVTATVTDKEGRTASTEFHFQEAELFRCVVTETASMSRARSRHTATRLTSGKVLVVGGVSEYTTTQTPNSTSVAPSVFEASTELYDPSTGAWAPTGAMGQPRAFHHAHLLPSGKVLVVGGFKGYVAGGFEPDYVTTVELYEPLTGTWTSASELGNQLVPLRHSVLLASGKVLMLGQGSSALYDPEANTWTSPTALPSASFEDVIRLPSGKVLAVGTRFVPAEPRPVATPSAWLYDPGAGTWTLTGPLNTKERFVSSALSQLPSGKVLFIFYLQGSLAAEIYDAETDTWAPTASPPSEFSLMFAATTLPSGKVLVTHGESDWRLKVFDPATGTWTVAGHMPVLVPDDIIVTPLSSGQLLLSGGQYYDRDQPAISPVSKTWLYNPGAP